MELNPFDFKDPSEYTREDLIDICMRAVVPCSQWRDRDSFSAQVNLQEVYDYLKRGYDYDILTNSDNTVWVTFKNVTKNNLKNDNGYYLSIDDIDEYREYCNAEGIECDMFESVGRHINWNDFYTFHNEADESDPRNFEEVYNGVLGGYLPTEFRLAERDGDDWY